MKTWREVKDERINIKGCACEECGEPQKKSDLIGHHVIPRRLIKAYRLYLVELCRLRCRKCEAKMHARFKTGNDPSVDSHLRQVLKKLERSVRDGYTGTG